MRADGEEPAEHAQLDALVSILDGLLEYHALALDLITQAALLFVERCIQFIFQFGDLVDELPYLAIHDIPLGR